MADSKQAAQPTVSITRQPDGRHAVTDAQGNVLGLHNSPVSAARQVSSYFGQPTAEAMEPGVQHTLAGTPAPTNQDLAAGMAYGAAHSAPPSNADLAAGMAYGAANHGVVPPAYTSQLQAMQQQLGNRLAAQAPQYKPNSLANYAAGQQGVATPAQQVQGASPGAVRQLNGAVANTANSAAQQSMGQPARQV